MREILINKNKKVLVDDDDYEYLTQWKWCLSSGGYAQRLFGKYPKYYLVKMHRFIMDAPKELQVDHINGDRLDNRKNNLRLCSCAENSRNRIRQRDNKSGYKGVCYHKKSGKWVAQIHVDGKNFNLGYFITSEDAARAYDIAALDLHKEFAKLNF